MLAAGIPLQSGDVTHEMRSTIMLIGAMLAAGALAGLHHCSSRQTEMPAAPVNAPVRIEQRPRLRILPAMLAKAVHDRINRERRKRGLPTFRRDAALGRIAGKHSRDMAGRNYFSHTSPEGTGPAQRYLKERYACGVTIDGVLRSGAEAIYRFFRVDADVGMGDRKQALSLIAGRVVEGWLETVEDRKNLLSPHWQREGVGVFVGPDGMVYVTVNFC